MAKLWWIVPAIILTVSLGFGTVLSAFVLSIDEEFGLISLLLAMTVYGVYFAFLLGLTGAAILSMILIFIRYYKNLFTDEGYLTFTLPVSRKKIIGAKTLNAMIWYAATDMVAVGGLIIILVMCALSVFIKFGSIEWLTSFIQGIIQNMGFSIVWNAVKILFWGAELLLFSVAATYTSVQFIQFCLTFGATSVRKLKLLVSFGVYYLVQIVISNIIPVILFVSGLFLGFSHTFEFVTTNTVISQLVITVAIPLATFATLAVGLVLHFLNIRMTERRLNLA